MRKYAGEAPPGASMKKRAKKRALEAERGQIRKRNERSISTRVSAHISIEMTDHESPERPKEAIRNKNMGDCLQRMINVGTKTAGLAEYSVRIRINQNEDPQGLQLQNNATDARA